MSGNIGYNPGIPAANNNPTTDQPLMQQNTNAIKEIIGVDHVTFEANNSGWHQQVTYVNVKATGLPGTQTDPTSIAYTALGMLNTTPQNMFKNSQGPVVLSCVKAFGVFTVPNTVSNCPIGNSFNVAVIECTTSLPGVRSVCSMHLANGGGISLSSTASNTIILTSIGNNVKQAQWTMPSAGNIIFTNIGQGDVVNFAILQF